MNEVYSDISKSLKIVARRGDTFNLLITVNNLDGSAYDFTGHTVNMDVFTSAADREANLSFASGSGLTLASGEITLLKTVSEMDPLRRGDRLHFLRVTFPDGSKKLWFSGPFVVNEGISSGGDNTSVTLTINALGDVVTLSVGASAAYQAGTIPIADFDEELQFGRDKELAFNEGGALSFTLADEGNLNGVGIILKLNLPVSVAFSADFTAMPNSQAFDPTKMNLTTLVYFSDFDGEETEKVLYNNIQLTAI